MLPLLLAVSLVWSTSLDEALESAKAEGKLVVVHLRSRSAKANVAADATLAKAAENEDIAYLLESFVLLRRDVPLADLPAVRGPALIALDPDGNLIRVFEMTSEKEIGAALTALRDAAKEIVRASDLRAEGKTTVADVVLGREIVNLGGGRRGAEILRVAARELRRQGDESTALYADLWAGIAYYTGGEKQRGRAIIESITRRSDPPLVVAEAFIVLGDLMAMERKMPAALHAYRRAYDIAPLNSDILRRARRALETYDTRPLPPRGETRTATLQLIAPAKRAMIGRGQFIVEADPVVGSVELFLDDVPVARDDARPFRMSIDVGSLAVMRTVKAVGYDDSGQRVGEAVVVINDRVDAVRVNIIAPAEPRVRGRAEIQVTVSVPSVRTLDHLELYWKEKLIATLHEPPFRRTFDFPDEFGYVRAVATLDDGTTAEDARIVNAEGVSESVDVRAVTLLAAVTDANGNRVEGLTEEDFVIEDEGTLVRATVRRATDTPVTIGIAIDSSGSMEQWIFEALEMAANFVRTGEGSDDRAFVVAFDHSPRLAHPSSVDHESLRNGIMSITTGGGTSIFDGVVFALQQFQNVPGRKALLVISDGREGMSSSDGGAAIRTARASAIPIYGLGSRTIFPATLQLLSEATGGVTFHTPRREELPAVFARIRDDVRGQYLITFEVSPHVRAGTWRNVRVKAKRADVKVRTMAGYYAR